MHLGRERRCKLGQKRIKSKDKLVCALCNISRGAPHAQRGEEKWAFRPFFFAFAEMHLVSVRHTMKPMKIGY
ncbi:hypothetical protein PATSB16_22900 [Pandoraea thiooxydans]|nr:hypothetical protein PATSB16_22900 [Pandoraea thiooxydans]